MKLIIVSLGVFLFVGVNAESFSSDEEIEVKDAVQFGILDKLKCKLCEEAMKLVEREIKRDSSKEEIKNALDRACTIIPEKRLRTKCRDAIKNKGDEIAGQIVGHATANAICKLLQFC